MKRLCLFALALLVPVLLAGTAGFAFEAEELYFSVTRDPADSTSLLWTVEGDYYFSNLSDEAFSGPIAFPIPSDGKANIARLRELKLVDPEEGMQVRLEYQNAQGLLFNLALPARGFAKVRIGYDQAMPDSTAVYILKSANTWGRPLPYSGITLKVQTGLRVEWPGFPDPHISDPLDGGSYRWEFHDHVFQSDFRILLR